ncbi:MAG: hypothetical protein AAFP69_06740, partial [Planctomycetota bacterium]
MTIAQNGSGVGFVGNGPDVTSGQGTLRGAPVCRAAMADFRWDNCQALARQTGAPRNVPCPDVT